MRGQDGRKKLFIDMKFTIYAVLFFTVITIIVILIRKSPIAYQNCSQIKVATGRSYIKEGDPLYQSRLDQNHNNIACE